MKRLIFVVSAGLILVACSTTSYEDNIASEKIDVTKIKNEDFVKIKMVEYDFSTDRYQIDEKDNTSCIVSEGQTAFGKKQLTESAQSTDPLRRGVGYCYAGKTSSGLAILDSVYAQYQNHPTYWNQIGICFLLKKDYRKAILYFNKSLEFKDRYSPALNNLGVIYLHQGRDQKALVAFQKAVYRNKGRTPLLNLANLYLKYSHASDALEIYQQLLKDSPLDHELLNGAATAHLFLKQYPSAISYYKRIPKNLLERSSISINYALALHLSSDSKMAKEVFEKIDNRKVEKDKNYYNEVAKFIGFKL